MLSKWEREREELVIVGTLVVLLEWVSGVGREFGALSLFWIQDQVRSCLFCFGCWGWGAFPYDYYCHLFHRISPLCFVCNSCLFTQEGVRFWSVMVTILMLFFFFISFEHMRKAWWLARGWKGVWKHKWGIGFGGGGGRIRIGEK